MLQTRLQLLPVLRAMMRTPAPDRTHSGLVIGHGAAGLAGLREVEGVREGQRARRRIGSITLRWTFWRPRSHAASSGAGNGWDR